MKMPTDSQRAGPLLLFGQRAGPLVIPFTIQETPQEHGPACAIWSGTGGVGAPKVINPPMGRTARRKPAIFPHFGGCLPLWADMYGDVFRPHVQTFWRGVLSCVVCVWVVFLKWADGYHPLRMDLRKRLGTPEPVPVTNGYGGGWRAAFF